MGGWPRGNVHGPLLAQIAVYKAVSPNFSFRQLPPASLDSIPRIYCLTQTTRHAEGMDPEAKVRGPILVLISPILASVNALPDFSARQPPPAYASVRIIQFRELDKREGVRAPKFLGRFVS